MTSSVDLDWAVDGSSWPHAKASRFRRAAGITWHVQVMGEGPPLLLIHGTGASTHSWRCLAPLLASRFTVIAPDLPGHGFTECPPKRRLSLPEMTKAVVALMDALGYQPEVVIGHSAGVAIAIRGCLDGSFMPHLVIGINAALLPFRGPAGYLFPPLAKLLFANPITPRLFARSAGNRKRVARLIRGTGSELDEIGIDFYARLFRSPAHVAATLGMMANWDLYRFAQELPKLKVPLSLMVGENDLAVAPTDADRICQLVSKATALTMPGLGHLAHEEDPHGVAQCILSHLGARRLG
jgi:magnesium chelatase accessory protein